MKFQQPVSGSSQSKISQNSKSFSKGTAGIGKQNKLSLVENDYFSQDDKSWQNLRNLTHKAQNHYPNFGLMGAPMQQWATNAAKGAHVPGQHTTRHRAKSIGNANSVSTPDFNFVTNKLSQK